MKALFSILACLLIEINSYVFVMVVSVVINAQGSLFISSLTGKMIKLHDPHESILDLINIFMAGSCT